MNSANVDQTGVVQRLNEATVLRAEIFRIQGLLDTEKRLRKNDRDMFAKKVAEYLKLVQKKEADTEKMKQRVENFDTMKELLAKSRLDRKVQGDLLRQQSAILAELRKMVKDSQADVAKERENAKNLEDTIKSMRLASEKQEADLLKRESELAKLKAEMAKLSKAGAEQASELANLKSVMGTISVQTATMSTSAQNVGDNVCIGTDAEARSVEATGANDVVQSKAAGANLTTAASENPANEPLDDSRSQSNAQIEAASKKPDDVETFVESSEQGTRKDSVVLDIRLCRKLEVAPSSAFDTALMEANSIWQEAMDAIVNGTPPSIAVSNANDVVVLAEDKIPSAEKHTRATAGTSAEETRSCHVPETEDTDSILDYNIPPNPETNARSLGNKHTKSPVGEKNGDAESDDCNSTAALDGRDAKSECGRSSNPGSGSRRFSSSRSGSPMSISSSDSSDTILVESDDSRHKQRKRESVSRQMPVSSSKRSRPYTTAPPTENFKLNSKEGGRCTASAARKSEHLKSGSSASGRNDKRESRSGSRSKERDDRLVRPGSSREAKQRRNSPIDQRYDSPIPANQQSQWIPMPPVMHVQNLYLQQVQQPVPLLSINLRGRAVVDHHSRGAYGNGGYNQQQLAPYPGGWRM